MKSKLAGNRGERALKDLAQSARPRELKKREESRDKQESGGGGRGDVVLRPLRHPEVRKEDKAGGTTSKEKHRLMKVQGSVVADVLRARRRDARIAGMGQQQPVGMRAGGCHGGPYCWGVTGGTGFVKEAGWEEGFGCMGQQGQWEGCCLNNSAEVTRLMHA